MQERALEPHLAVKAGAYHHYGRVHTCCHVQDLPWSSYPSGQTLAYLHLGPTYIFCHVHRANGSMGWPQLLHTSINELSAHPAMY